MAKLQLKYYPADVLKQKAKKISRFDASVRKLAADMLDTMYQSNGCGLAAPQVGVSKRIMVIDISRRDDEESDLAENQEQEQKPSKPFIFINPEIIEKEGELTGLEGCLSFPGVFFEVKRANRVVVRYQNLAGKEQKMEAEGDLLCRAIQHEIDHLNGELFIDKAVSPLAAQLELSKHGFGAENIHTSAFEADHSISLKEETTPSILIG
jgi:peptide deformylase